MKCVEFEATCLRESDLAILVDIEGEEFWIPKTHVSDDSEVQEEGDEGTLIISEWIAEQKELM